MKRDQKWLLEMNRHFAQLHLEGHITFEQFKEAMEIATSKLDKVVALNGSK